VKKRRQVVTVEKEKLKYWHLIKRDVLKHKRLLAEENARDRLEQSRRLIKWLNYINLCYYIKKVLYAFTKKKEEHERLRKQNFIVF